MTSPSFEDIERQREREKAVKRKRMAELCENLKQSLSLSQSRMPYDILHKQAELLDELFCALMKNNLRNDIENGYFSTSNMAHILHIQRQCMDTVKASEAIEYMKKLTYYRPPSPTHHIPYKQSEETL